MRHLSLNSREVSIRSNPNHLVYEYSSLPPPFDRHSQVRITGSYPKDAWLQNPECDELLYVAHGSGTVRIKERDHEVRLRVGDVLLIPKHYVFRYEIDTFDGLLLFVTRNPKVTREQDVTVQ